MTSTDLVEQKRPYYRGGHLTDDELKRALIERFVALGLTPDVDEKGT
jgi:hypothetical protein